MNLAKHSLCWLAALTLLGTHAAAQTAAPWVSVHQSNGWYGTIYETALKGKYSWITDIQLRRMGLLDLPKQLDALTGINWRATQGIKLGIGYQYIASAPYGKVPAPYPTRENVLWYQVQLQSRLGSFEFAHRYRYENRWTHDVIPAGDSSRNGETRFSHRVRYQFKASHAFSSVLYHKRPVVGLGSSEFFLGLTPSERQVSFDQNRSSIGIGLPLTATDQFEVGYLQQWIANTRYKTREVNQALLVMFVHKLPR